MLRLNLVRDTTVYGPPGTDGRTPIFVHYPEDKCDDCDRARSMCIASLCTFDWYDAAVIRFQREEPKPPQRWLFLGNPEDPSPIGCIESRAWVEWHWFHQKDKCSIPSRLRAEVLRRDADKPCAICSGHIGPTEPVDVDHDLPFSRGGATTIDNLRAAHAGCNRRRRNKMERFYDVDTGTWHTPHPVPHGGE